MSEKSAVPEQETIYAIRRADGELIHDNWSFAIVAGPNDWSVAEEDARDSGSPVTYELVEMTVKMRRVRTLPMCAESRCNHVAEFWGLCKMHAREDDPELFEEMMNER